MKQLSNWGSKVRIAKQIAMTLAIAIVFLPTLGHGSSCGTHTNCTSAEDDGHGGIKNVSCGGWQGFIQAGSSSSGTTQDTGPCIKGCDQNTYHACSD